MRILVLEDEDSIRQLIEALVEARGYQVVGVDNGLRALDEATLHRPDVVLLDLMVPGAIDGFEVCRRLRAHENTREVPIFVISAMEESEAKPRALLAGANKFFSKPFSARALLHELETIHSQLTRTRP